MCDSATSKNKTETTVLTLPAVISLTEASALRQTLLDTANHDSPITIDGSSVQRIDTAGLQLLTAFIEYVCHNRKGQVNWDSATDAIIDGAAILGLTDPLGLHNMYAQNGPGHTQA